MDFTSYNILKKELKTLHLHLVLNAKFDRYRINNKRGDIEAYNEAYKTSYIHFIQFHCKEYIKTIPDLSLLEIRSHLEEFNEIILANEKGYEILEKHFPDEKHTENTNYEIFIKDLKEIFFIPEINPNHYYQRKFMESPNLFQELWDNLGLHIEITNQIKKEIKPYTKFINRTGFSTNLDIDAIERLYKNLKVEKNWIDTDYENWHAVFSGSPLPKGFQRIKWLHKNKRGDLNQTSFRVFLQVAMGIKMQTIGVKNKKIMNDCFSDSKGNDIILTKPKIGDETDWYTRHFLNIIKP